MTEDSACRVCKLTEQRCEGCGFDPKIERERKIKLREQFEQWDGNGIFQFKIQHEPRQ